MSELKAKLRTNTELFQREFETITHNIANANTAGYKKSINSFQAVLTKQLDGSQTAEDPTTGYLQLQQQRDFSQGRLIQTGRSLDFALTGSGFFEIESPQGPAYTRNGVFSTDHNGQLVDTNGYIVAGEGGPITIPPNANLDTIEVSPSGSIKVDGQTIGQFRLADFPGAENQLIALGDTSFVAPTGINAQAPENLSIHQGFQEGSNVDTVKEMVGMLTASRLYEANMNFIAAKKEASQAMMDVAMG